jgi:hypothetical protein
MLETETLIDIRLKSDQSDQSPAICLPYDSTYIRLSNGAGCPNDKRTADQIAMNLRDRPKEDMSID